MRKTRVYIAKFKKGSEEFYKVGYTSLKNPYGRFIESCYSYDINIIFLSNYLTRKEAQLAEQKALQLIKHYQIKHTPKYPFVGYTECFCSGKDNLNRIINYVKCYDYSMRI